MPLVSVVLPVPRSPVSRTSTGGFSRLANSRPQRVVSSAECVMTSSITPLQLLEKFMARSGDGCGNIGGQQAGLVGYRGGQFGRFAMEVDAQGERASPIVCFELGGQRGEQSGQDIAGAAFGEAGV